MGYIILILFIIIAILSYLEDYIKRYRLPLYLLIGFILVLLAGLREVGIDPDSENYEYSYQNFFKEAQSAMIEPSFIFISYILNQITNNVHAIFLFYAFFAISIKMYMFRIMTNRIFATVLIYLSFYYILHELTQIRVGLAASFFFIAIIFLSKKEKKKATITLLIGSIFHYSSLALLPVVFIKNNKISNTKAIVYASLIPLSYIIYFAGLTVLLNPSIIPLIGEKLALYQNSVEKGKMTVGINVFDPAHIVEVILYCYSMYFRKTLEKFSEYTNIILKIISIGLFLHTSLAFLPVLALRISQLYNVVNIILYLNIFYTFKQKWIGTSVIVLISLFLLYLSIPHYGLGNIIKL